MQAKKAIPHLLILLTLSGITLLAYWNSFQVPLVFDDQHVIEKNEAIRDVDNFLTLDALTRQRPLTDLTFALNYAWHGLDVFGYHVVNFGIHILSVCVAYFLALAVFTRLNVGPSGPAGQRTLLLMAAITAAVFALHPVQTQAVTYIAQRYTSMAALFYMASVLLYILGRQQMIKGYGKDGEKIKEKGPWVWPLTLLIFGFSFTLALAAFASKQNALSLPLAILLVEYMLFDRTWAGWKKKLLYFLPVLALFLGFALYSAGVLQGDISLATVLEETDRRTRETFQVTRWQYLLTQFKVICIYLGL